MAPHLVTREPAGELFVIDLIPAAERDQQFAHAVAMLQYFLLQFPSIAHQMARRLVLRQRYVAVSSNSSTKCIPRASSPTDAC